MRKKSHTNTAPSPYSWFSIYQRSRSFSFSIIIPLLLFVGINSGNFFNCFERATKEPRHKSPIQQPNNKISNCFHNYNIHFFQLKKLKIKFMAKGAQIIEKSKIKSLPFILRNLLLSSVIISFSIPSNIENFTKGESQWIK